MATLDSGLPLAMSLVLRGCREEPIMGTALWFWVMHSYHSPSRAGTLLPASLWPHTHGAKQRLQVWKKWTVLALAEAVGTLPREKTR
jgi:hypothetical protein